MEQNEQTSKSLEKHSNLTPEKTLGLAKNIIAGQVNLSVTELGLSIENSLDNPTIRKVFKGDNASIGYAVVKVLVNRFIDSFGFSTKLGDTQLETLTVDTLEKFSYESLEDIMLFFKMARNGSFGSTKRGVDSNLIYGEWFPKYLEAKAEVREKKHLAQKKLVDSNSVSINDVQKAYQKIQKGNSYYEKVLAWIEKITEGICREELEFLIQEWESDPVKKPYVRDLKKKRLTIKN